MSLLTDHGLFSTQEMTFKLQCAINGFTSEVSRIVISSDGIEREASHQHDTNNEQEYDTLPNYLLFPPPRVISTNTSISLNNSSSVTESGYLKTPQASSDSKSEESSPSHIPLGVATVSGHSMICNNLSSSIPTWDAAPVAYRDEKRVKIRDTADVKDAIMLTDYLDKMRIR